MVSSRDVSIYPRGILESTCSWWLWRAEIVYWANNEREGCLTGIRWFIAGHGIEICYHEEETYVNFGGVPKGLRNFNYYFIQTRLTKV